MPEQSRAPDESARRMPIPTPAVAGRLDKYGRRAQPDHIFGAGQHRLSPWRYQPAALPRSLTDRRVRRGDHGAAQGADQRRPAPDVVGSRVVIDLADKHYFAQGGRA
ncbi:hypothetical protein [Micromonospora sp. NBC_00858]|uniref:hypothetical protein n=1 Tax=Micromonospora sp. NBC_00858 TaxID=2975979 RepID=UPI00386A7A63|nr:hypothetical protein OG990_06415 [Micromonospora sp. NBC_00858]